MNFFRKREKSIEQERTKTSELKIQDLFWRDDYGVDIHKAKEIMIEVYRTSRMEDDWEVPETVSGIRLLEDGVLIEDIELHSFGNFGLFSYTSIHRHKTTMELAIHLADFIANKLVYGCEMYEYKIKKHFLSKNHIYLLSIPTDYEVDMPKADEHYLKMVDFELREHAIRKKQIMNPTQDFSDELNALQKENQEYFKKYMYK